MTSPHRPTEHYQRLQRLLDQADQWTSYAHSCRAMSGTDAERAGFAREAARADARARHFNALYLQAQRRP